MNQIAQTLSQSITVLQSKFGSSTMSMVNSLIMGQKAQSTIYVICCAGVSVLALIFIITGIILVMTLSDKEKDSYRTPSKAKIGIGIAFTGLALLLFGIIGVTSNIGGIVAPQNTFVQSLIPSNNN
jgi:hypothetical protein